MSNPLDSWEYPKGSGILIRLKINTRGEDAFGTSYLVNIPKKVAGDKRRRTQKKTKEQAEAWADEQWRGLKKQGETFFNCNQQERNDFVEMLPSIRESRLSFREIVEFALPRMTLEKKTFRQLVSEMTDEKEKLLERDALRPHSLRSFKSISSKVVDSFGEIEVSRLTKDDVKQWVAVDLEDLADRTRKNYLNNLNEILSYASDQGFVFENVVSKLTNFERKTLLGLNSDAQPEILSIDEAQRLLNAAFEHKKLNLLPSVVLGLFCGIRTEELQKLRWESVRIDEGFVNVEASIAKKRRIRNVTLPENAKRWLSHCSRSNGLIAEHQSAFRNRFDRLVRLAGFVEGDDKRHSNGTLITNWKKNAMRHSFGSYHFALHGDSMATARELGHKQGDDVLFSHYRALATKDKGRQYFEVKPISSGVKVVEFVGR